MNLLFKDFAISCIGNGEFKLTYKRKEGTIASKLISHDDTRTIYLEHKNSGENFEVDIDSSKYSALSDIADFWRENKKKHGEEEALIKLQKFLDEYSDY